MVSHQRGFDSLIWLNSNDNRKGTMAKEHKYGCGCRTKDGVTQNSKELQRVHVQNAVELLQKNALDLLSEDV